MLFVPIKKYFFFLGLIFVSFFKKNHLCYIKIWKSDKYSSETIWTDFVMSIAER